MIDLTGDLYAEIENDARISYVRHKAASDGQQVSMWDFKEAHLANAGFKVGQRVAFEKAAEFVPTALPDGYIAVPAAAWQELVDEVNALRTKQPAKVRYDAAMAHDVETDPIEDLRFFLSIALSNPQDWIDVEPFLDAIRAYKNDVSSHSDTDEMKNG